MSRVLPCGEFVSKVVKPIGSPSQEILIDYAENKPLKKDETIVLPNALRVLYGASGFVLSAVLLSESPL